MTYQEEKKKKLIIFGSGKVATRFLVNERLSIDGVFDNNKVGDRFWNITITRPMYNSQYYIIIATQNAFLPHFVPTFTTTFGTSIELGTICCGLLFHF